MPRDLDFNGVNELEIIRKGDATILGPIKPRWGPLVQYEKADEEFMADRGNVVCDEGRFNSE